VEKLGLPKSLHALGLPEEGINRVARLACQDTYANPRPLEQAAISRLLWRAWAGALPTSEAAQHALSRRDKHYGCGRCTYERSHECTYPTDQRGARSAFACIRARN